MENTCEILKVWKWIGLRVLPKGVRLHVMLQGREVNRAVEDSNPHQTTSQPLGCIFMYLLSCVPNLDFCKGDLATSGSDRSDLSI